MTTDLTGNVTNFAELSLYLNLLKRAYPVTLSDLLIAKDRLMFLGNSKWKPSFSVMATILANACHAKGMTGRPFDRCVDLTIPLYFDHRPELTNDHLRTYDDYWKDIVEPDGILDMDAVKRELHDYRLIMDEVEEVYCHITGNRISKLNTRASVVISEADEHYQRLHDEDHPSKG